MMARTLDRLLEKHTLRWLLGILLVLLLMFPWVMGESGQYYTVLVMTVFIFATLGHAWNLLAGFCGLLSFGTQVYIGLGGFTVAILTYYFNVPVWWGMVFAAVVTALFAWLLAAPISDKNSKRTTWTGVIIAVILWIAYEILVVYNPGADIFGSDYIRRVILLLLIFLGALPLPKLQGAYFAVATWLIAAAVASVFNEWRVVGAGGGMSVASDTTVIGRYYAGMILIVLSTLVVWWLLNSRYGQALTAVRDDEEAAMAVGIDIRRIKTMVFVISAPMAGLAAALYYIDAVTITPPDAFHIRWSAYVVFIVVAGGMGTLSGPIIGAIAFIIVQRFLVGFWGGGELTLGIAAVILILVLPRGIVGLIDDLRANAGKGFTPGGRASRSRGFAVLSDLLAPATRRQASSRNGQGKLLGAYLLPSTPLPYLTPDLRDWHPMRDAYDEVARNIATSDPDVIVLYGSDGVTKTDASKVPRRLSGEYDDPTWKDLESIPYDVRIDKTLAMELETTGVGIIGPDNAVDVSGGGMFVAAHLLGVGNRASFLLLSGGRDASSVGQQVIHIAIETGRHIVIVGIGGLSRSGMAPDLSLAPGAVYSADDDSWNRKILGLLERADAVRLGQALPEYVRKTRAQNGLDHLRFLTGALGKTWVGSSILGYGAAYGAGMAVVDLQFDRN